MRAQDTVFYDKNIWNWRGRFLPPDTPVVMGILNVTPDSFFDGGKYLEASDMESHARRMVDEGARMIDIGACSTRPGAEFISEEEELNRLIPAIRRISKACPDVILSADTYRATVAVRAVEAGAAVVNDISGGTLDNNMFETVSRLGVPYILTHIKGTPQTMQRDPVYENVVEEVMSFFEEKIARLNFLGTKAIILDPGFGFGKTTAHNYSLLKNMEAFKKFKLPLLAGLSRKSMINAVLKTRPDQALYGTIAANVIALLNGASVLRVHDVKPAADAVKIVGFYRNVE